MGIYGSKPPVDADWWDLEKAASPVAEGTCWDGAEPLPEPRSPQEAIWQQHWRIAGQLEDRYYRRYARDMIRYCRGEKTLPPRRRRHPPGQSKPDAQLPLC